MTPRAPLCVHLGGRQVGTLTSPRPDKLRFQYDQSVVESYNGEIVLSASLPARSDRYDNSESRPFFEGLLPESGVREIVARNLGLSPTNGFDLLAKIGRECAGAVVVLPSEGESGNDDSGIDWYSEQQLVDRIERLPKDPLGLGTGKVRLSLAGVQHKLVVTRDQSGRTGEPLGNAPTTHIIKPGYQNYEDIVANEAFCLRVIDAVGLAVAKAEIEKIGELDCLVVERFDRRRAGEAVTRLHQEDFCQALGLLPGNKYEGEQGPSVADSVGLIRRVSRRPALDVMTFLRALVINFLLGNSDAHGKNFALIYDPIGEARFAPIYDVVCTGVYDVVQDMAMAIGGSVNPEEIELANWRALAPEVDINASLFLRELEEIAARVWTAIHSVHDQAKADGWSRPILDAVVELAERRISQITS